MSDRRVGKHALDIHLHETGESSNEHGQDNDNDHDRNQAPLQGSCHNLEETEHCAEGCELNRGGHEARHGSWSTGVNIGRPRVEGSRANLEEQADHHHDSAHQQEHVHSSRLRGRGSCIGDDERTGVTVEESRTHEHEARGERTKNEVLQRSFLRELTTPTRGCGQDVQRKRHHFESNEKCNIGIRCREDHHAAG